MSVEYKDYYETLGVPRDADQAAIAKAYKKLARKYHPDINQDKDAEDKFKEVGEAYQVLKDPEARARYDALGSGWRPGQPFPGGNNAGAGGFHFSGNMSDLGDFSEFFNTLFGNAVRQQAQRGGRASRGPFSGVTIPRRGQDLEAEVSVTLEEVYHGTKKDLSLKVRVSDEHGTVQESIRKLKVTIPAGTSDGTVLRLAGQGSGGSGGGDAGDLRLRVKIEPHRTFMIEGHDLTVRSPITPWEAALGATIKVPTLDGEVALKIPAGIQGGQKLRLKGKGLPSGSDSERGDLFVKVRIAIPSELTYEEQTLFESLAKVSEFSPRD